MNKFNIRVYAIIEQEGKLLVSKENRRGVSFTKFPGGGLEWGEGIVDALKREMMEELQSTVSSFELFYLTEHFQVSAFNEKDQLISIYYKVKLNEIDNLKVATNETYIDSQEIFIWKKLNELSKNDFSFPIDQLVFENLYNLD